MYLYQVERGDIYATFSKIKQGNDFIRWYPSPQYLNFCFKITELLLTEAILIDHFLVTRLINMSYYFGFIYVISPSLS